MVLFLRNLTLILQLAAFFVLGGRAWQHLTQGTPYRTLLWDESLLSPFVNRFLRMEWTDYVNSYEIEKITDAAIQGIGYFLAIAALMSLIIHHIPKKIAAFVLTVSSLILFFIAWLYYADKGYQLAQWLEYSAQFSTPLLLFWAVFTKRNIVFITKIVVAITFVAHGMYALGWLYQQPGRFVDMMIVGFELSEPTARQWLVYAGWLDILIAIGIFLPYRKIVIGSLIYAILWGLLTTSARLYTTVNPDLGWYSWEQWLPHFFYRFPHFLLPLWLLLKTIQRKDKENSAFFQKKQSTLKTINI